VPNRSLAFLTAHPAAPVERRANDADGVVPLRFGASTL